MKKIFALFLAIGLNITLVQGAANGKVELSLSAPGSVAAGDAFTVKLAITKQNVEGFARFHQDLPQGFEAEQIASENAGAVFSFADQRVRFIWTALPKESVVNISYRVRAIDPKLKGALMLAGRFTYMAGETRKSVDVESSSINVVPSNEFAALQNKKSEVVVNQDIKEKPESQQKGLIRISAVRQKPYLVDKSYYVNVLISKGELTGFGRLEEELPSSRYKVEMVDAKEALWNINDGKISFVWTNLPSANLPSANSLLVSYKLTPLESYAAPNIKGTFTYSEGEQTEQFNVVERDVDYSSMLTPSAVAKQQTVKQDTPKPASSSMQQGLVFKVQLLASQSIVNADSHFAAYKIDRKIIEEVEKSPSGQSTYKYVVGPFAKYEQASEYRDLLHKKGITDAFVTCYYNGKRITMQEALEISKR